MFSIFALKFQIISNTVRMQAVEIMFSFFSIQLEIVSNTVTMRDLDTLFSKCSQVFALTSFYSYYSMSHDGNTYVCLSYLKNGDRTIAVPLPQLACIVDLDLINCTAVDVGDILC